MKKSILFFLILSISTFIFAQSAVDMETLVRNAAIKGIQALLGEQSDSYKISTKHVSINKTEDMARVRVLILNEKEQAQPGLLKLEMFAKGKQWVFTNESVQIFLQFIHNEPGKKFDGLVTNPVNQSVRTESRGDTDAVIQLVNQERAKVGLMPLTRNDSLTNAAQNHAQDMATQNYVSHYSKDGRTPDDRVRDAGYEGWYIGENIAAGYSTPAAVMQGWMNSEGHRSNILNPNFTCIGVGKGYSANSTYKNYWAQNFGGD